MEKKTECEIVQDLLLGYIDGVLNKESKKLVEKHLSECKNCQKRLEEIKQDMKENETNQKKEIDYLKKIRRKSRIKSILIAIGIVALVFFIVYLYKFIIISDMVSKSEKSLESNNFYKESSTIVGDGETSVIKTYYKDGKWKQIWEIYSDDGKEILSTRYATANTDERITISDRDKKVILEHGDLTKLSNTESALKGGGLSFTINSFAAKLGTAFIMSISTDTYDIGKEYYVIRNKFETNNRWEEWVDKETGMPLRTINRGGVEERFPGTDVVKEIRDNIQEYKYSFGTVTDEDVEVPEINSLGYEIENKEYSLEALEQNNS